MLPGAALRVAMCPLRPLNSACRRRRLSGFGAWLVVITTLWIHLSSAGVQAQTTETPQAEASTPPAAARELERPGRTGLPIPRFVSLRKDIVNLRRGPGMRYPIDWVYQRRDLPVEVIDEFEIWRQIRDHDGTTGWVHQGLIKGERFLLIVGERRVLRRESTDESRALAMLEPGVLVRLNGCDHDWCRVEVDGLEGWMRRSDGFGVYPEE